jgi:hypothetical protein
MHPVAVLHQHLQEAVPSIHGTRLKALMAAVGSVLCGAHVSITSLGRGLSNTAFIKHKIKRMDRLIGNTRLYQERWRFYAALTQWQVTGLPHPIILIDWSPSSLLHYQSSLTVRSNSSKSSGLKSRPGSCPFAPVA